MALKELLVIERTPEPEESTPPETAVDLNQLDAEQKRQVEAFVRSLTVCHATHLRCLFSLYSAVLLEPNSEDQEGA